MSYLTLGVLAALARRTNDGFRSIRCISSESTPTFGTSILENGYGERSASPTPSWRRSWGASPRATSCSPTATSSCCPSLSPMTLPSCGTVRSSGAGRIACRTERHPAGHRPAADADRLRGDEPLGQRRRLRAARLPQEQRAGRLLLGAARARADRDDRHLRPPAERGRHRLRCDRPRRGDGAERARCPRRSGAHQPERRCRRLTDPLGADRAVRPRPTRPRSSARSSPSAAACRWRRSWPRTTSSSTACCRTRRSADLPHRGPRRVPAGQPHRRRVLRRGHGLQLGPPTTFAEPIFGSGTTSTTTPSTTARRICGTRPPGRSARLCCRSCGRCWQAAPRGTPRPSAGPSRSATARSSTRTCCSSSSGRRSTRTRHWPTSPRSPLRQRRPDQLTLGGGPARVRLGQVGPAMAG